MLGMHGKQAYDELRKVAIEQWQAAHFDHCSRDWPHADGRECYWPPPAILGLNGEDAARFLDDLVDVD